MPTPSVATMEPTYATQARAWARDRALDLLQRLTVSASIAAVAGVGIFSVVSAATIPGTPASSTSSGSTSSSTADTSNASTSSGTIQPSSGVSSSSGRGVAVTGGS